MTRLLLGFLLILVTSFSFAEDEVTGFDEINERDEIQEIIDKNPEDTQYQEYNFSALALKALKDPQIKEKIAKQFDESNISLMSMDQKRKHFNQFYKNSFFKAALDKVPKLRDIFIDVITDKDSILGLLSIFQKEQERLYALYFIISVFILNFILKKLFIVPGTGFFSRLFLGLTISGFSWLLTIGGLFYLFQKELAPIVKVVKFHL